MRKTIALLLTITLICSFTFVAFAKEKDKGNGIPEGAVVTFDGKTGITTIVTTTFETTHSTRTDVSTSEYITTNDMSSDIVGDPVIRTVTETEYRTQGQGNGNGNYQFRTITIYYADTTTTKSEWVETTTTVTTTTWEVPVTTTITTVTTSQHHGNVNSNGKFIGTTVASTTNSVDGTPIKLGVSSKSCTVSGTVTRHSTTESVSMKTDTSEWAPVK